MKRTILLSAVCIAGCASVPSDAPPYARAPEPSAGESNVYIYRVGAYPTLRTPSIVIDGVRIFDPPEKAYTVISVPAGSHSFVVDWSRDTGWPDLEFPMEVVSGTPIYIKISGSFEFKGGDVLTGRLYEAGSFARAIRQTEAEEELAACCRFIAPRQQK